jgi:heme exporter protein D
VEPWFAAMAVIVVIALVVDRTRAHRSVLRHLNRRRKPRDRR